MTAVKAIMLKNLYGIGYRDGTASLILAKTLIVVALVAGQVVFTPTAGFSGAAGFDYTVADGNRGTDTGRVSISVGPIRCRLRATMDIRWPRTGF